MVDSRILGLVDSPRRYLELTLVDVSGVQYGFRQEGSINTQMHKL